MGPPEIVYLFIITKMQKAFNIRLGPVVQSIVSLTSSLVVKMLTILVRTISNSQVFLLKKMWVAFANAKATHIFFQQTY